MKIIQQRNYPFILIVLVMLSVLSACSYSVNKPKIGDIYVITSDVKSFTTWKITDIKSRQIWYIPNDYHVSDTLFIDSINYPKNYTDLAKSIKAKEFRKITNKYKKPKSQTK